MTANNDNKSHFETRWLSGFDRSRFVSIHPLMVVLISVYLNLCRAVIRCWAHNPAYRSPWNVLNISTAELSEGNTVRFKRGVEILKIPVSR